jgi:outer membrane protein assembly factor BamB
MMGLYCYDMAGKLHWHRDLGTYETRAGWGTASSPSLFEGKLFLQFDNQQQSFLVALDAETGHELWRVKRDEVTQYSTPIVWRNSRRNELVAGGEVTRSYDPATGKLLWKLDMAKGRSSATPLAVGDRLYVGTEFRNRGGPDDGGGFLFAVKPGGSGDITPPAGADSSEFIAWTTADSGIQMASPVLCRGHIFLLERRLNIVNCIDAETGAKVYRTRIPGSRAFWASPWTCGDCVYCLDDAGTTFVLAGGSQLQVLRQNVIDERAWSTPAIANGALFLRTIDSLYCIVKSDR